MIMAKKLSKKDITSMIDILEVVKYQIAVHEETFVCIAISNIFTERKHIVYLNEWIKKMLDNRTTLYSWIYYNKFTEDEQFMAEITPCVDFQEKLRLTRVNWLNWMIDQLKSEKA
jgi:hypothetical protein